MQDLQKKLGHKFKNIQLLEMALTHRSCGAQNNERMEFLGDSILNFIAAELIFELFPRLPEGNMSRVRAGLVREETLVKVAERLGIEKLLHVVHSDRNCKINPSMLADAVEAIYAAVYLDAGMVTVKEVIRAHLMEIFKNGEAMLKKDPKTALQEYVQGRGLPLPLYSVVAENQLDLMHRYKASCEIPKLKIKTTGMGPTRKQAESIAADEAMKVCMQ